MSTLSILLLLLLFYLGASAAALQPTPSISLLTNTDSSGILASYNLPVGLLPDLTYGYDLDPKTGKFSAYVGLEGGCSFTVENYEFEIALPTVTGFISRNRLRDIQGINVKAFLVWIDVHEVERLRNGMLKISAGLSRTIEIPADKFSVRPSCGPPY